MGCLFFFGFLHSGVQAESVEDPYENFNRKSYQFSEKIDKLLLAPLAKGYSRVLPDSIEQIFSNVFANIDSVPSSMNGFLQGRAEIGVSELSRLVINSSFGLGGLFDPATAWGIEKQHEDIGQTFAVWGVKDSPFIYIPILGPSTVRDMPVRLVGMAYPRVFIGEGLPGYATALRVVGQRAEMMEAIGQRDASAIDPYAFTRDAYKQRRAFEIFNGDPPVEDFFEDFEEN